MKVIKIDLPSELQEVEIHTFADEHIGDSCSDLKRLQQRINYVRDTPNAYCVLNGDIIDFSSRSSVSDIETRKFSIMEQVDMAVELLKPISDKILAMTTGNHEARVYKHEGVDISKLMAIQLGVLDRYDPISVVCFVKLGENKPRHRKFCYSFYMTHGAKGGSTDASKATALVRMADRYDTDFYMHGHFHQGMVFKKMLFRIDHSNCSVTPTEKMFVGTASNLDYGGYGEIAEYAPTSKKSPVVYLSGTRKYMDARI